MLYQLSYASVTYSAASAPEHPAAPLSAWSGRRESNPQPTAWKAVTLPLSYSRVCSMTRIDAYEDFIYSSNGVMYLRNLTRRWLRVRRRFDRERRRCRRWCGCGGQCALAVARL